MTIRPRLLIPEIFNGLFIPIDPMNVRINLKFVALPVPEIIGGGVLKNYGQSLDTAFKVIQGR